MEFQFDSFNAFMWMKGHGPYVWAAYGITLAGLCGLGLKIRSMHKNFFTLQASIARRQAASSASAPAGADGDNATQR